MPEAERQPSPVEADGDAEQAVCVEDSCELSHCSTCDAHPGDCSHTGPRYLAPITYEPGPPGGWVVPELERERWENPVKGVAPRPPGYEPGAIPRELALLASDLEHWLFLDGRLRAMLDEAYERNPLRVTRMAERVIAAAKSGAIRSPDGLLASYLREDLPGSRS